MASSADKRREDLSKLARAARAGIIDVDAAAEALGKSSAFASRRLATLTRRGWVSRVRRGVYQIKPLDAPVSGAEMVEDAWILASRIFEPCYVGGWSAAEHWGLTEQIFRTTLIVTAAEVRNSTQDLGGYVYRIFRVPRSDLTGGLRQVWRGAVKVAVSGPERTIVDGVRHPAICGGLRHVAEMMAAYAREGEIDIPELLRVGRRRANGAAWKRLGYLAEQLWPPPIAEAVAAEAQRQLSAGYIMLDPAVKAAGHAVRRWRLRANVAVDSLAE